MKDNDGVDEHFGPYTDLVRDVIDFALSESIAAPSGESPDGVVIVMSSNEIEGLPPARFHIAGPEDLDWKDLLEFARAEYLGAQVTFMSPEQETKFADRIFESLGQLEPWLMSHLPLLEREEIWLLRDLIIDCASCRMTQGSSSGFWEKVYACVKAGLLPIHWSGQWPEGNLVCIPLHRA